MEDIFSDGKVNIKDKIAGLSRVLVALIFVILLVFAYSYRGNISDITEASLATASVLNLQGRINPKSLVVDGNYVYLATPNNSRGQEFYVLNISVPSTPSLITALEVGASINQVFVAGDYAYLVTEKTTKLLDIIDITNPSNPKEIGSFAPSGTPRGLSVFAVGSKIYIGLSTYTNGSEFNILDVSNPARPVLLGGYEVGAPVNSIIIVGNVAYLATNKDGGEILALDVTDPSHITEKTSYNIPWNPSVNAVAYDSNKIYVATSNERTKADFLIFDVSDQNAIIPLGSVNLGSGNTSIAIYKDRAYVTTKLSTAGLKIVDISNPQAPLYKDYINTSGSASAVRIQGNYLYIATASDTKELQIFTDPYLFRPNIVFIMTDDQRWDTLSYMTNVENMIAARGVLFKNAFATTPICCTSRASFLTGEYDHHLGVLGLPGDATVFTKASSTIAVWLKNIGYSTSLVGKYLNGYYKLSPWIPPGWDNWRVHIDNGDPYYNYSLNENGVVRSYGSSATDYSTDVFASLALNFIKEHANRPFFLLFTPSAPHGNSAGVPTPAPRHNGRFANIELWRPPSWFEPDVSDKPAWLQLLSPTGGSNLDNYRIKQLESLLAVDEAVGSINNLLDELQLTNDTIVVYTSDQGVAWGEHRWGLKLVGYEESIRIPFIMRYPRLITEPREENRIVLNIDVAPTLAELSGTVVPGPINGRSLVDIIKNVSTIWRDDFLLEFKAVWYAPPDYNGVRAKRWKYIKSEPGLFQPSAFEELYDLESDPYELNNLLYTDPSNPAYQQKAIELRIRLEQLKAE